LLTLAAAERNPAAILALQQQFGEQDALRQATYGTERYQGALRAGGPEAAKRIAPGIPLPPIISMEHATAPDVENYAAVPSKPGEPTTRAYALPKTLEELTRARHAQAVERQPFDPFRKTTVKTDAKGNLQLTSEERDKPLIVADPETGRLTVTPEMVRGLQSKRFEIVPLGPAPNGAETFLFQESEAAKAGLIKSEQSAAERAGRLGVPYSPGMTSLPGSEEIQETTAKAREEREEKRLIETEKRASARKGTVEIQQLEDVAQTLGKIHTLVTKPGVLSEQDFSQKGMLGGLGSAAAYNTQQRARLATKDPDLIEVQGLQDVVLSLVAKSVGREVGNLSAQEREGARALTPQIYDTQATATRKLQALQQLITERQGRRAAQAGLTSGGSPLDEELRRRGLVR
jgi:hypothetical protein